MTCSQARRLLFAEYSDQPADLLSHSGRSQVVVGAQQRKGFVCAEHIIGLISLRASSTPVLTFSISVKEVAKWYSQRAPEFKQPSRDSSAGAAFVLLHLLKADANGFTQLRLAHADKYAPASQSLTDVYVKRVFLSGHKTKCRLFECIC